MKKLLSMFAISNLTTLILTTNSSISIDNNIVNEKHLLPKSNEGSTNEPLTHLFNNQFNYLSDSNWITNQSDSDQKFYSYDTNHANYQLSNGTNARDVFVVDTNGNLNYDPTLILEKDKVNIDNTRQEMINNKKITMTKDKKI